MASSISSLTLNSSSSDGSIYSASTIPSEPPSARSSFSSSAAASPGKLNSPLVSFSPTSGQSHHLHHHHLVQVRPPQQQLFPVVELGTTPTPSSPVGGGGGGGSLDAAVGRVLLQSAAFIGSNTTIGDDNDDLQHDSRGNKVDNVGDDDDDANSSMRTLKTRTKTIMPTSPRSLLLDEESEEQAHFRRQQEEQAAIDALEAYFAIQTNDNNTSSSTSQYIPSRQYASVSSGAAVGNSRNNPGPRTQRAKSLAGGLHQHHHLHNQQYYHHRHHQSSSASSPSLSSPRHSPNSSLTTFPLPPSSNTKFASPSMASLPGTFSHQQNCQPNQSQTSTPSSAGLPPAHSRAYKRRASSPTLRHASPYFAMYADEPLPLIRSFNHNHHQQHHSHSSISASSDSTTTIAPSSSSGSGAATPYGPASPLTATAPAPASSSSSQQPPPKQQQQKVEPAVNPLEHKSAITLTHKTSHGTSGPPPRPAQNPARIKPAA